MMFYTFTCLLADKKKDKDIKKRTNKKRKVPSLHNLDYYYVFFYCLSTNDSHLLHIYSIRGSLQVHRHLNLIQVVMMIQKGQDQGLKRGKTKGTGGQNPSMRMR